MLTAPRRPFRLPHALTAAVATAALIGTTTAPSTAADPEPGPVDRAVLRDALRGLPDSDATAAQVRVTGSTGRFAGRGGVRELGVGDPVPRDARFRIASVTKMFTATVVLQLAGEGRVNLGAPVQRYLPRLLPSSYPSVPVRSLLDHTSGLPHSTEDAGYEDPAYFVAHRFDYFSPREVVATATAHAPAFEPGTRQEYNGVNYFVAGLLVEAVTGRSFAHELRHRVLGPLRLDDTRLPGPRDVRISGPHAHGYVRVDGVPVDVTAQSSYGWAESGIVSTTADLQHFLRTLIGGRLLAGREQRELFRVPDVPFLGDDCGRGPAPRACYSTGLTRTDLPGGVVVWGKSGSVTGTSSGVFTTRDRGRVLAYAIHPLGNRDGSEGALLQRLVTGAFGLGASQSS